MLAKYIYIIDFSAQVLTLNVCCPREQSILIFLFYYSRGEEIVSRHGTMDYNTYENYWSVYVKIDKIGSD
jgi:hypothetical protein